ncbi:hypothetical protein HanPSC8_Chr14g0641521 [Helianthus annuus]|nr:hypothetical protein HanPSC8_Chr14g0641521 [Helianthus annuus]
MAVHPALTASKNGHVLTTNGNLLELSTSYLRNYLGEKNDDKESQYSRHFHGRRLPDKYV